MSDSSPSYRYCWWCSGKLWGRSARRVDHPSGPVYVHACCEDAAAAEISSITASTDGLERERRLRELADGLPALAAAAVREHLRYGAEKHGATPTTSSGDQSPLDHWYALLRHIDQIEGRGDLDLARLDPHSHALHLTAVVCRGLLALDGVLRAIRAAAEPADSEVTRARP